MDISYYAWYPFLISSVHLSLSVAVCLSCLLNVSEIEKMPGVPEHKRRTPTGDKFIFRAHPSWQSGRSWHDWALFSWTDTDETAVRILGQIITFIWFAEEDISKIQHLSYVSGDTPGLYVMIETLERPLTVAKTYDRVVVGGRKQLTTNEFHERRRNGMSLTAPNLCLVPVDTIYEAIAAIPDEGGSIWKPPGIRELTILVIDLPPEIPYPSQAFPPYGFLSIRI